MKTRRNKGDNSGHIDIVDTNTRFYIYIAWNSVKGRQTASTHKKTIVAWIPYKAVKSCPYIQFKTIYSTTLLVFSLYVVRDSSVV